MENLKDEESYKAVEKNLSGSRPRELFEDVVEDAEKDFEKHRAILKVRRVLHMYNSHCLTENYAQTGSILGRLGTGHGA